MRTQNKLSLFFIMVIPFWYQLSAIISLGSLLYLPYILIILSVLINFKCYKFNKKLLHLLIVLIIAYIIVPLIFYLINKSSFINISYLILQIIFIFALFLSGNIINDGNFYGVIKGLLISNSLILFFNIVANIDEINMTHILSIFSETRINRASFSFPHPNMAAIYIFIEIILFYIYSRKKLKVINLIFIIIGLLCLLLATGSRTAIISIILFFILEIIKVILYKFEFLSRISIFFLVILPIFLFSILCFDFKEIISNTSGRDYYLSYNIAYLIQTNKILYGIGIIPLTEISVYMPQLMITDNWYVSHIICYGFYSLLILIYAIIYLFYKLKKNLDAGNYYILFLLIVLLFYCTAENVFFVPGVLMSFIFWLLFIYTVKEN